MKKFNITVNHPNWVSTPREKWQPWSCNLQKYEDWDNEAIWVLLHLLHLSFQHSHKYFIISNCVLSGHVTSCYISCMLLSNTDIYHIHHVWLFYLLYYICICRVILSFSFFSVMSYVLYHIILYTIFHITFSLL